MRLAVTQPLLTAGWLRPRCDWRHWLGPPLLPHAPVVAASGGGLPGRGYLAGAGVVG